MRRAEESRHRELIARARARLSSFDEERILAMQALVERLISADRLDPRALAELERLVDSR